MYSGAGSVGGNINLVSKVAGAGKFTTVQAGAGTDGYGRLTLDSNTEIGDSAAFRINAMAHQNDAPGRDVETFERWGIAPSIVFGLGTRPARSLSYFHQTDNNIPQYGVPYFSAYGGPLPGATRENYYGYCNVDSQDIDVDMLTGVIEYDFSDDTTLRSLARFQKVDQYSVVDAPQGTWCLAVASIRRRRDTCRTGQAPGSFLPGNPSGPRGYVRDTQNSIAISQTDLITHFDTGASSTRWWPASRSRTNPSISTPARCSRALRTVRWLRCRRCRSPIRTTSTTARATSRAPASPRAASTTSRSTCSTRSSSTSSGC